MKKLLSVLLILMVCLLLAIPVSANSAEPPGLIIIATGLPENAQMSIQTLWGTEVPDVQIDRQDKLWESYFRFFYRGALEREDFETAMLVVSTPEGGSTYPFPQGDYRGYSTVLTLDYSKNTLTMGQDPWRQPIMTVIRILLTLLCEGLVFFLFGFRSKRSWLVFLAVNLLTQGWLNIVVNNYAFVNGYWIFSLLGMELLIFIGEAIAIPLAVKERKGWQRVVYALTANGVSLFVGMQLISHLPL